MSGHPTITDSDVAVLARAVGLSLPAERIPVVTERLRDLYELAEVIERTDLTGIEIPSRFDASWPAESDQR